MCKFIKIIINRKRKDYKNIKYLPKIISLYERFSIYLNDDFSRNESTSPVDRGLSLIESCGSYFWVIQDKSTKKFAGFVFLQNWIGGQKTPYSAEVTTCFEPEFWGVYTKDAARLFIKYCFKNYKLKKIKALIYPQNFRVKGYLNRVGFSKEGLLKSETLNGGKPQDIEIYSIFKGERC